MRQCVQFIASILLMCCIVTSWLECHLVLLTVSLMSEFPPSCTVLVYLRLMRSWPLVQMTARWGYLTSFGALKSSSYEVTHSHICCHPHPHTHTHTHWFHCGVCVHVCVFICAFCVYVSCVFCAVYVGCVLCLWIGCVYVQVHIMYICVKVWLCSKRGHYHSRYCTP